MKKRLLLSLDGIVVALRPDLRAPFEEHPRNGKHGQRDEAEEAGCPIDAHLTIHYERSVFASGDLGQYAYFVQ